MRRVRTRRAVPLTVRLTATTAMVVAAALLVVAGLTVQVARHHLTTAFDERLRATADSFRNGPAHRITAADQLVAEAARWLAAQAFAPDEVAAVRMADGEVLTSTGGLDLANLPRATELLTADQPRWWDLRTSHGPVRALTVPLGFGGRQIGTLLAAGSRSGIDATIRALTSAVARASALGLLFAAVLAFVGVRRTLGPLLRMSRDVDAIHVSGDLTRRVQLAGPRDEVGRLAEAFNRLLGRADDALRSQRRFVSDASHELRTPLTVARGQVELALPASPAPLGAALTELDRMARIVEELLLLARLDEGLPLAREPVEVELVVEEALLRGLRLAYREAEVDAQPGLYAMADPDRLLQVVSNVVVNAVQHTGDDGRLAIRTRCGPEGVAVVVADTGPGIAPESLPHVFDRFYRATDRGGGAGLGLAIADSLVRAMGGRIAVESSPGAGTTFTVTMPPA